MINTKQNEFSLRENGLSFSFSNNDYVFRAINQTVIDEFAAHCQMRVADHANDEFAYAIDQMRKYVYDYDKSIDGYAKTIIDNLLKDDELFDENNAVIVREMSAILDLERMV